MQPPSPERYGPPDPPTHLLALGRAHLPLLVVLAACATLVVAADPPPRLDLLVAEWCGSVVALAMVPLLLIRGLGVRKAAPVLVLTLATAVALAQGRDDAQADDGGRLSTPAASARLPTASDGFGAYTHPRATSRNS